MDDMKPMSEVAEIVGVDRNTIARWVKSGRLAKRSEMRGNMRATLVSVAAAKKIVAQGETRGRPRKN